MLHRFFISEFSFLPPFAPSALPDFFATMLVLTPARLRFRAVLPRRSPVVTALPLPDILPPTTPTISRTGSASPRPGLLLLAARLRLSLAGSAFCCGRIVFTFVAVYQVLFVALHPASRRRSYFKFSSGTRFPMAEVFHLGGSWRFTAHSRAPVGAHVQRDCASCLYPVVLARSSLHHRLISTEPPAHRSVELGARLVNLMAVGLG